MAIRRDHQLERASLQRTIRTLRILRVLVALLSPGVVLGALVMHARAFGPAGETAFLLAISFDTLFLLIVMAVITTRALGRILQHRLRELEPADQSTGPS